MFFGVDFFCFFLYSVCGDGRSSPANHVVISFAWEDSEGQIPQAD